MMNSSRIFQCSSANYGAQPPHCNQCIELPFRLYRRRMIRWSRSTGWLGKIPKVYARFWTTWSVRKSIFPRILLALQERWFTRLPWTETLLCRPKGITRIYHYHHRYEVHKLLLIRLRAYTVKTSKVRFLRISKRCKPAHDVVHFVLSSQHTSLVLFCAIERLIALLFRPSRIWRDLFIIQDAQYERGHERKIQHSHLICSGPKVDI